MTAVRAERQRTFEVTVDSLPRKHEHEIRVRTNKMASTPFPPSALLSLAFIYMLTHISYTYVPVM